MKNTVLHVNIYPTLVILEQSNCIDWIYFCYIWSLTKNKAFLVPDLCRSMVRNGYNISADFKENTIKNDENKPLFVLFFDNLVVVFVILPLQDKQNIDNIHTLF